MPFFSIVIPLYNKAGYIAQTLQSITAQTFTDYEIIVVNDASTDASVGVLKSLEIPGLRLICHDKNQGLSASRNTGIEAAKADYVAFLDADDLWKPDFLQRVFELIEKFPQAGLFATAYNELYDNGREVSPKKNIGKATSGEMQLITDFFIRNAYQPIYCFSSIAIKKEVFEKVGGFDPDITLGEDVDFNIRANREFLLAFYDKSCSSYRIFSENQITTSSIIGKTITDFDRYETPDYALKRYLDVNRYILAIAYKIAGEKEQFQKIYASISLSNMTFLQRIRLKSPVWFIRWLYTAKLWLLKKGIRVTTFGKS